MMAAFAQCGRLSSEESSLANAAKALYPQVLIFMPQQPQKSRSGQMAEAA